MNPSLAFAERFCKRKHDNVYVFFLSRLILKDIFNNEKLKEGDYRDWDAILAWAKGMHLKLADERAYSLAPV